MSSKIEQLKKQSALAALQALIAEKAAAAAVSKYTAESAKDEFINSSGNDTGRAMQWLYEQCKAKDLNEEVIRLTELADELKASFIQQV